MLHARERRHEPEPVHTGREPMPAAHLRSEAGARTFAPPVAGLTPLARKAYDLIKRLILENKLHGGEHVLEEDLARAAGMSRTPIREALVQIQNEGLVTIVPRRGVRVVPLSVQDVRDVYDILRWLESQAASLLASRPDRAPFVASLRALIVRMEAALGADDIDAWASANAAFHAQLVAASGNRRLAAICANLLEQSQRVRAFVLRLRKPPVQTTRMHADMLRAIEQGKAEEAAAVQAENKAAFLEELESIFAKLKLTEL